MFRAKMIAKIIKAHPDRFFRDNDGIVEWDNYLKDKGFGRYSYAANVSVRFFNVEVGYINSVHADKAGKTVEIGHFAVASNFIGTGISYLMADVLKKKLGSIYGIDRIIFNEKHLRFSEMNYVRFFTRIGAVNVDPKFPKRWEWIL